MAFLKIGWSAYIFTFSQRAHWIREIGTCLDRNCMHTLLDLLCILLKLLFSLFFIFQYSCWAKLLKTAYKNSLEMRDTGFSGISTQTKNPALGGESSAPRVGCTLWSCAHLTARKREVSRCSDLDQKFIKTYKSDFFLALSERYVIFFVLRKYKKFRKLLEKAEFWIWRWNIIHQDSLNWLLPFHKI